MEMEKFDIERYISGADSICREERQYALYLNNVLMGTKKIKNSDSKEILKKILSACGLPEDAHVDHVFYEAAFMRDLFNDDKETHEKNKTPSEFNDTLLKYICEEKKVRTLFNIIPGIPTQLPKDIPAEALKYHLGAGVGQETLSDSKYLGLKFVARVMMNAKPDIAVIYHRGKPSEKYLHFIECKYLSSEDIYKQDGMEQTINQTTAQRWIAHFLCDKILEGVSVGEKPVKLVRFLKIKSSAQSQDDDENVNNVILITHLIKLHKEIFPECQA